MDNYRYCAHWVLEHAPSAQARVLDYGCGAGQIVKALRDSGIDGYGCDAFYEGGDYSKFVDPSLFEAGIIKRMDGETIPFAPASFDIIVNNQVLEHVEDLDRVLAELSRALKPGGVVLSLFPDRGVWREGHCGIPFLHWFPKRSRPRVYYAACLRALGLGYHKGDKSVMRWSEDFCDWLDQWTHYRSRAQIESSYAKHFAELRYVEDDWLQKRVGARKAWIAWLPAIAQKLIVRKLGCLVFVARKPA